MPNGLEELLSDTLSMTPESIDAFKRQLEYLRKSQSADALIVEVLSHTPHGTTIECITACAEVLGKSNLLQTVQAIWPSLDETKKLAFAVVSGIPPFVNAQFWSQLFYQSSNTVHVRHRIAAGLAVSSDFDCRRLFRAICRDIGQHDDPQRQAVLRAFLESHGCNSE